jgi:uncharacterized protein YceH (UPF0502 family)
MSLELTPDECRVLGVLIEKELTTPDQYPLSLNALLNGANQKNNRDPVTSMQENDAFDALESLRAQSLVVRVDTPGQRVNRYRHNAKEVLRLRTGAVAILAELLLRGPQTLGELRGRASRMHPMDSLEMVKDFLRELAEHPDQPDQPLAKMIPPSPGSRAERYVQLLCPDLHPLDVAESAEAATSSAEAPAASLSQRVTALEAEVASLKQTVRRLAVALGEPDPGA